ncbi:hypothetical protein LWI29_029278 [Acer saccharum]|uniref:Uncharacterized protein n=1 Tax=Acer saccharum TaxID=4024 RepID=A0AA39SNQ2_ACESA|nr:hypothetical protein LWI29_029278 [Acer saccharum]
MVALLSTSHAAWKSLEKRYASQSKTCILQLKNQLHNTKRGDLSISDFVDKITHIVDNLALTGKPDDDDDLITIIMNNVGLAYEVTVNSAQAQDTSISLDDFIGLLLSTEMQLNEQNSVLSESIATTFYAPQSKTNSSHDRGSFNSQRSSQNHQRLARSLNPSPQSNSSPSDNRQKC